MSTAVSPLAPTDYPAMPAIAGVKLATAAAGIRYKGRTDVLLAVMDKGTAVAGVFTRSKCPSAPVEWCRAKLAGGRARALVVNSGNANAFTGKTGKQSTALTAQIASKAVGCGTGEVFLASTGVIGEPLDATKFDGVLAGLAETAAPDHWMDAAKAIMTTDTFPKVATATVKLGTTKVTINGMAKGAGMIARAGPSQSSGLAAPASVPSTPSNLVASSGSPITPVEARNTSFGLHPTALAAICAVSAVDCRPVFPVKALALPELTTSARALPRGNLARHHSTGADGHLERVNTPATAVSLSMTASSTSLRFL